MSHTFRTTPTAETIDAFGIHHQPGNYVVALAGNPNTGKSTVFNALTGLRQHTGNWPGKTVTNARGTFQHHQQNYELVDLPGVYSLFAVSEEEVTARDYLCFGHPDVVVVVADATALERNLNLVFQIMELTDRLVLCINLVDEAKKHHITIDHDALSRALGIPVVPTAARSGEGLTRLKQTIEHVAKRPASATTHPLTYSAQLEAKAAAIHATLTATMHEPCNRWLTLRVLDGDDSWDYATSRYLSADDALFYQQQRQEQRQSSATQDAHLLREEISELSFREARRLKDTLVTESSGRERDTQLDDILTSKTWGMPIMLLLLACVFWLTIQGANYPSQLLASLLFGFEDTLFHLGQLCHLPPLLSQFLIAGVYRTLVWVVSVMLPPMAIFFPLFTLLEDVGYLPRIAFNMDHLFKKACAHGKQCLTLCMGFGCNAAGIVGCRIIESPRERLIAILTNNFVPCNGRFPTLIAIATIFFGMRLESGFWGSVLPALMVTLVVILGIVMTLLISYLLSKTLLKGLPTTFTLELPPYRTPQIGRVIYTAVIDRIIFVLSRAVVVAIPAGAIIWLLANTVLGDQSLLNHLAEFLQPLAACLGLDGFILLAFILSLPANELLMPIMLMAYLAGGAMVDFESYVTLGNILTQHGWTWLTALNVILFCLFHWPCATTLLTMKKETGSWKWTALGFILPTVVGLLLCLLTTATAHLVTALL